jgi:steroid delta-isomerase-like uncharacterized protein
MASLEENKAISRRFIEELMNRGNTGIVDELAAPDVINHHLGLPPGGESIKRWAAGLRSAFPDLAVTIEDMIAEGDRVMARVTVRATHGGTFMGIPPTGQKLEWEAHHVFRIADGKIVERWLLADMFSVMQSLGAISTPG